MARRTDLATEFRTLFSGRVNIADGIIPPLVFVAVNSVWGVTPAATAGVTAALAISGWRLAAASPCDSPSPGWPAPSSPH